MTDSTRSTSTREHPLRIGVLISGGGSTMVNLVEHIAQGVLDAVIGRVIASNPKARGIELAREFGLDVHVVPRKEYDSVEAFSDRVFDLLREARVELVVLGGFLSLLPKHGGKGMYGRHVHEAVLAAGDAESGCTVHFADNEYDQGPIILQRRCEVRPDDTVETLQHRVMIEERKAYPQAIQMFAEGRLRVEGQRVRVVSDSNQEYGPE